MCWNYSVYDCKTQIQTPTAPRHSQCFEQRRTLQAWPSSNKVRKVNWAQLYKKTELLLIAESRIDDVLTNLDKFVFDEQFTVLDNGLTSKDCFLERCVQLIQYNRKQMDLSRVEVIVLYHVAGACNSAVQKCSKRFKWDLCNRLLWMYEDLNEGIEHLNTLKDIGGLGFHSPAVYLLALITVSVFSSMKEFDLLSASSEFNLISLIIWSL